MLQQARLNRLIDDRRLASLRELSFGRCIDIDWRTTTVAFVRIKSECLFMRYYWFTISLFRFRCSAAVRLTFVVASTWWMLKSTAADSCRWAVMIIIAGWLFSHNENLDTFMEYLLSTWMRAIIEPNRQGIPIILCTNHAKEDAVSCIECIQYLRTNTRIVDAYLGMILILSACAHVCTAFYAIIKTQYITGTREFGGPHLIGEQHKIFLRICWACSHQYQKPTSAVRHRYNWIEIG